MLWHKAWLETRWRFLIGLGAADAARPPAPCSRYPQVAKLLPLVSSVDVGGELGRQIQESAELARDLPRLRVVAVVPAEPAPAVDAVRGAARNRRPARRRPREAERCSRCRCRSRATACSASAPRPASRSCSCWPSSPRSCCRSSRPRSGRATALGDALVHGACLFIAGSVFFSLTFLLSTVFSDVWRPPLIVLCAAVGLGLAERLAPEISRYGVLRVMSAEAFFRQAGVPWLGLIATAAASAVMLVVAGRNITRRDF